MRKRLYTILGILVFVSGLLFYIRPIHSDTEWTVLSVGIPDRIIPEIAISNMGLYILKQTHEPLFRESGLGTYESKILTSWSRNEKNTSFILCPDSTRKFNTSIAFNSAYLARHLQKVVTQLNRDAEITFQDDCVKLDFNRSLPNFFAILTRYEFAPSIPSGNPDWEIGLGPYEIATKTDDQLLLKLKPNVKADYKTIRFIDYNGRNDPILNDRSVEDFNRVLVTDQPKWLSNEYKPFGIRLLQTINLVLSIKDDNIRSTIFNCLPISEFRAAFAFGRTNFSDIDGVLPVGVASASTKKVKQNCNISRQFNLNRPLTFINWNAENIHALRDLFSSFEKITGIQIKIKTVSTTEFVRELFGSRKDYDLYVIAIDAVRPDVVPFLEPIVHSQKRIIEIGPTFDRELEILEGNHSIIESSTIAEKINRAILDSHIILPLYQENRTFYYPHKIKNLTIGRDFLEYPEVVNLRL